MAALLTALDVIGSLLENHVQLLHALRAEHVPFAVQHLRAVPWGKAFKNPAGKHVAALGLLVAQNAVVKQIVGRAFMNTQQRGISPAGKRFPCFTEPHMCRKLGKGYLFADGSVFVEDGFPKFIEAETSSAEPYFFRFN